MDKTLWKKLLLISLVQKTCNVDNVDHNWEQVDVRIVKILVFFLQNVYLLHYMYASGKLYEASAHICKKRKEKLEFLKMISILLWVRKQNKS